MSEWRFWYPAGFAVLICTAGCVTSPSSRYVFEQRQPGTDARGGKILVVTDICVKRNFTKDHGKGEYVSVFDSRRASRKAREAFTAFLLSERFPEPQSISMAIGGHSNDQVEYNICEYPLGSGTIAKPPFWINPAWQRQFPANAATHACDLLRPISTVFHDHPNEAHALAKRKSFQAAIQALKDTYHCDAVLLVVGEGKLISVREQMKEVLPQAIISAVVTLGTVSFAVYHVNYITLHAALVDADSGEIVWANRVHLGPEYDALVRLLYEPQGLTYEDVEPKGVLAEIGERISDPRWRAWHTMPRLCCCRL